MKLTVFILEAINYFVAHIHYWMKAKFLLEVSENKVEIFSPAKFKEILTSILRDLRTSG